MHIHMQHAVGRLRHRHFVAFPILACTLLSVFSTEMLPIEADLTAYDGANAQEQHVHIANGVQGLLLAHAAGSSERGIFVVRHGDIVVRSLGLGTVQYRDVRIVGWNGGYHASAQGETLTVAALTTPVVLQRGMSITLVPLRKQIRLALNAEEIPVPTPLPAHYLYDQLQRLHGMELDVSQLSIIPVSRSSLLNMFAFFQFPAARDRTALSREATLLQELAAAVATADDARVRSLLAFADVQAVLQREDYAGAVAQLLAERGGRDEALLSAFLSDDERVLLGSAHPMLWDTAWLWPLPFSLSREAAALRLLLPPKVDRLETAMSPLALNRWQEDLETFLGSEDGSEAFRGELIAELQAYVTWCQEERLPDRCARYQGVLAAVTVEGEDETLISIAPPAPATEVSVEIPAVSDVSEHSMQSPLPIAELIALAQEVLLRAGAMVSKATTFAHTAGDEVAVEGVIIASKQGDLRFDFELNPVKGEVRAVRFEHRTYPLALPIEAFMAWAREGVE